MYLGIDIGTTTVAAILLDDNDQIHAAVTQAHHADLTGPADQSEQDPHTLCEAVNSTVCRLPSAGRQEVTSIGVTGQMHGVMLVDDDRNPCSPLITWQDRRCLAENFICELHDRSGCSLNSGYGSATLAWLVRKNALPAAARHACTIQDYLVYSMCELARPITDPTNAASWGCFNLQENQWQADALHTIGIPATLLPVVAASGSQAGTLSHPTAKKWSLPAGIPVATALGDNQASLLATLLDLDHDLALTLGTGGQLSAVISDSGRFGSSMKCEIRPFPGNRQLLVAAVLSGGSAWAWLAQTAQNWLQALGAKPASDNDIYQRLNQLGLQAKADLQVEPHFIGERAQPDLRASISGISVDNFDLGTLSRSLAQGIFINMKNMMPAEVFPLRTRIVASGNALRLNPLLRQAAEEVFQLPVVLSERQEEAACGAAVVAKQLAAAKAL
jgi:sedoheptulokinase